MSKRMNGCSGSEVAPALSSALFSAPASASAVGSRSGSGLGPKFIVGESDIVSASPQRLGVEGRRDLDVRARRGPARLRTRAQDARAAVAAGPRVELVDHGL